MNMQWCTRLQNITNASDLDRTNLGMLARVQSLKTHPTPAISTTLAVTAIEKQEEGNNPTINDVQAHLPYAVVIISVLVEHSVAFSN